MTRRTHSRSATSRPTALSADIIDTSALQLLPEAAMGRVADYFYRRLSLMRGQLLAARSNPGVREIHDLRVATRRTTEIIAILALTGDIPAGQARSCIRRLRKLRRAAGRIRDLDVHVTRLSTAPSAAQEITSTRHRRLARQLAQQRQSAIGRLQHELQSAASDSILHRWIDHARTMHLHLDPRQIHNAMKDRLAFHRKRFQRRSRRASADAMSHHIHKARIAAKQWRYLLELIHDIHAAPAPAVNAALGNLKAFQKAAGDLQDAISFQAFFNDTPAAGASDAATENLARIALRAMQAVG